MVDLNENGHLLNPNDWNLEVAHQLAENEGIADLTEKHMDLINYLRDEYINNNGNQPSERAMIKAMSAQWGEKVSSKDLYKLFPRQPSKQATKLAGLPETKRKGGY